MWTKQGKKLLPELPSNQEETDSRVVLYSKFAAENEYNSVRDKSPDSDIFWILLHHSAVITRSIVFETGYDNKKRRNSISKLARQYDAPLCSAFLGLHLQGVTL